MRNVITLILGGGKGTRLYPLTKYRSKPAVPLAGKYRLIDIPISNCLNSGLNKIYVLTQFNSTSLNTHVSHAYRFDPFNGGSVDILAAQQTNETSDWYQGTADAVRQNLRVLEEQRDRGARHVLILSGDQLYRMDYEQFIKTHLDSGAHATIGCLPVDAEQARAFGIMRLDAKGRVTGFLEKPKNAEERELIRTEAAWIDSLGLESKGREFLASMGIYVFNMDTLLEVLTKTSYHDFGKEIFPAAIRTRHVQAHLFDGYWEDIGTIKAFYECNLQLAGPNPPFEFVSQGEPIFSRARFLPPTRFEGVTVRNSLVADGCSIGAGSVIENSVIGLRSQIGRNVTIRDTIVMGADFFSDPHDRAGNTSSGRPAMGIGDGSLIETAIVDKNCRIGRNVVVHNRSKRETSEESPVGLISDGIIIFNKGAELPDGWTSEAL